MKANFLSPDDGNALRRIQQIMRYALIGRIHNLLEDLGGPLLAINIVLAARMLVRSGLQPKELLRKSEDA
jgi:hypothetical protein